MPWIIHIGVPTMFGTGRRYRKTTVVSRKIAPNKTDNALLRIRWRVANNRRNRRRSESESGGQDLGERDLAFTITSPGGNVSRVQNPVSLRANQESMQMIVLPAHHDLQNSMELFERGLPREFDAPPDERLDVEK